MDCSTDGSGFCCCPKSNELGRESIEITSLPLSAPLTGVVIAPSMASEGQRSFDGSAAVIGAVVVEAMKRGPDALSPLAVVVVGAEADDNSSGAVVASVRPCGAVSARFFSEPPQL